ncbi:uncharacterized protein BX664DRAFT_271752 [Halteromyces radiatus]|uniref:uncharacterized protein n=1 Tax=Halteromyces radiatus TaxID=101107 RepID=UPI00221ED49E|nr:uncharacterized protein BX664DRAFT_271752 [Halteromyces radiatus]KAI8098870.1 hypothetical protein BX664DRAFT_271752 [Halteromyces radiatus]
MDKNQPPLSWWHVLESFSFVLLAAIVSFSLGLQLELSLIIASVRCVVQLTMMGYVLNDVFNADNAWIVMMMTLILILLGAYEVVFNRTKRTFQGLFLVMFVTLLFCTCIIGFLGTAFALRIVPFWEPAKFIPIIGMLLGNSMSSIAMATERCLDHVSKHAPLLETRLAYGASRYEAARPLAVESIRLALLPVITQLGVMGLINIPGTMVGLLLAGAPIREAVIYQQVIMFMVVASSTIGSIMAVVVCLKTVIDQKQMLRTDRIHDNKPIVTKTTLTKLGQKLNEWRQTACIGRYTKPKYEELEMTPT